MINHADLVNLKKIDLSIEMYQNVVKFKKLNRK